MDPTPSAPTPAPAPAIAPPATPTLAPAIKAAVATAAGLPRSFYWFGLILGGLVVAISIAELRRR